MFSTVVIIALWVLLVVIIAGLVLVRYVTSKLPMSSWSDHLRNQSSSWDTENVGQVKEVIEPRLVSLEDFLCENVQEESGYLSPSDLPCYPQIESLLNRVGDVISKDKTRAKDRRHRHES